MTALEITGAVYVVGLLASAVYGFYLLGREPDSSDGGMLAIMSVIWPFGLLAILALRVGRRHSK